MPGVKSLLGLVLSDIHTHHCTIRDLVDSAQYNWTGAPRAATDEESGGVQGWVERAVKTLVDMGHIEPWAGAPRDEPGRYHTTMVERPVDLWSTSPDRAAEALGLVDPPLPDCTGWVAVTARVWGRTYLEDRRPRLYHPPVSLERVVRDALEVDECPDEAVVRLKAVGHEGGTFWWRAAAGYRLGGDGDWEIDIYPQGVWVNVYDCSRCCGGPEEGGWYYIHRTPLASTRVLDLDFVEYFLSTLEPSQGMRDNRGLRAVLQGREAWEEPRPHYC